MKNKILFIASIAIFISTSKISAQVVTTLPITAVSFPKEVVPVDAGTIEFDAKMTDFSGYIPSGGVEPHFFEIYDGTSTYHIGFNGNDGAADGGLVGRVGSNFSCGTGSFGAWYFEDIYEAGEVDQWHHYKFVWDKDGFPQGNNTRKVDIYIDDVLNSSHWEKDGDETILQPTDGTFNLITCDNISDLPGVVAIDELKIYDGDGNLVLYNKLGSQQEIENSEVGLNGSFNGFGDAHFVPGIDGDAVEANPVLGLGTGVSSCNAPAGLTVVNITATTAKLKWNAVAGAEGYTVRYKVASTNGWKYGTTYGHSKPISGLLPNTVYKWEVKTFCHIDPPYIKSDWSSKQQFTTLAENSGADQYFTVPDGVTQLTVKLWGAGGAGGNYDPCPAYGGGGGYVTGTIIVTPGETLTIVVGGKGETGSGAGAYGGGGGKQSGAGGRGGGRSAVVRGDDDIITAGGGGGGGGGCYAEGETISRGGGGGGIEGTPSYWVPYSGEPGTNSHPGAAGYNPFQGTFGGNPGIGHDGGYAGIGDNGYNGSGGGGYYGGGSGTDWGDGGGGGGSGLVPAGGYSEQGNTLGDRIPGGTSDADYPGNNIGYGGAVGENGNDGAVIIVGYWPVLKLSENTITNSFQIYPNPAEHFTTIHFTLQQSSRISIIIYDLNGKEIETLVNDELQQGDHSIPLNTDHFSKGIYMVKMISDFGVENQKLIVQ